MQVLNLIQPIFFVVLKRTVTHLNPTACHSFKPPVSSFPYRFLLAQLSHLSESGSSAFPISTVCLATSHLPCQTQSPGCQGYRIFCTFLFLFSLQVPSFKSLILLVPVIRASDLDTYRDIGGSFETVKIHPYHHLHPFTFESPSDRISTTLEVGSSQAESLSIAISNQVTTSLPPISTCVPLDCFTIPPVRSIQSTSIDLLISTSVKHQPPEMNIVFPQMTFESSKLLHPIIDSPSTLKRKRYLADLDLLEEPNKRSRTAPPSPPLATVFERRSVSPTPQHAQHVTPLSPLSIHHSLITPESPERALARPVHIERAEPVLRMSTVTTETKLPSFKYLTQNDRYLGTSNHSLDYPDTCINDDDWRLNLELWIEKNFPEKFNNLKNLLRYDKPGFELLNDAIFLTELKEQLENARYSKMPRFTSKISKKMLSRKSNPFYKSHSDHSESEDNAPSYQLSAWTAPQTSPIPMQPQIKFPFEANYTYQSRSPLTSPISKHTTSFQVSPDKSSKPSESSPSHRQWNGHHKLNQGVMIETNQFIHTQNHKGPNHTYTIHHHNQSKRKCISCGSDQSPCWRPSWSTAAGQLCNSCGLRYKKTGARCIDKSCCRIPAKGEWTAMKSRGKRPVTRSDGSVADVYQCLHCGGEVEVKEKK